jgi:hypothetical protein
MKHGQGAKTWLATGDRYEGSFVYDLKHGQGTYYWGLRSPWAGERFEGQYVHDRRHGKGTYVWSSGDRYVGDWDNDLQSGLQTPMQAQRTRASKAMLEAIGQPGTRICGSARAGYVHKRALVGEVVEVIQDRALIRIRQIDGVAPPRDDVVFWDLILNWRPCR